MVDMFLNVLAVIGIVVLGGFIVIFLGNLLLSVLDGQNQKGNDNTQQKQPEQITYSNYAEPVNAIEDVKSYNNEDLMEDNYSEVDFDKAAEEERLLGVNEVEPANNEKEEEDAFEKLRKEEEEFRQERLRFIEEKRRMAETEQLKNDEDINEDNDEDDINLDDIFFEDDEEIENNEETENDTQSEDDSTDENVDFDNIFVNDDENIVEENVEEDEVEEEYSEEEQEIVDEIEKEEIEEESKVIDASVIEIQKELEKQRQEFEMYKKQVEEEKQKLIEEKEQALKQVVEVPVKSEASLSLEEYENRLEILQERLKANDKELKRVKKEYLPLARVRKSLENDKKKLRRREALVAKQKVVLYGVNNYVDIDEEKAKKLAEDLDLLDGLRVSVNHCEEVIENNKERLPILENTYNILKANSENFKGDISEVRAKIEELKAQNDDNNGDNE